MMYTHYGWFGLCPIYLANPYGRSPDVVARKKWLHGWLRFNVELQKVAIATCVVINPQWRPTWKIRLSGRLPSPVSC